MKVRLTENAPTIADRGMVEGRELKVVQKLGPNVLVKIDGDRMVLLAGEYEMVDDERD